MEWVQLYHQNQKKYQVQFGKNIQFKMSRIKTFEGFLDKMIKKSNMPEKSNTFEKPSSTYDDYENLQNTRLDGGEVDQSLKDEILDVNNFNKWLSNSYKGYGREIGQPGLVGRIDKLSSSMVEDYFTDQGVSCDEIEIMNFQDDIRKYWLKKRK